MYKTLLSIFTILFLIISEANANKNIIKNLKEGGKIIFIRHALAPGSGDPENFDLNDCKTQRNLSSQGIEQSKRLGIFFLKNKIPIDIVLSSEWCRCKDTAKYAFGNYETFTALKPGVQNLVRKQSMLVSDLVREAENLLNEKDDLDLRIYSTISVLEEQINDSNIPQHARTRLFEFIRDLEEIVSKWQNKA